jgi:hypothetical protein
MKKIITISSLMLMIISFVHAQCYSNKGIVNEVYASMTIVSPPAFDVSLGLSNSNIVKLDINYITKDGIVYGGAIGIRPYKISADIPEDAMASIFLGYNLAGCAIIGATVGVTHVTNFQYRDDNNCIKSRTGAKFSIGMSLKFISTYTKIPVTFGGYGSSAGIGITIGTIF